MLPFDSKFRINVIFLLTKLTQFQTFKNETNNFYIYNDVI
jgi:hypothetical protein